MLHDKVFEDTTLFVHCLLATLCYIVDTVEYTILSSVNQHFFRANSIACVLNNKKTVAIYVPVTKISASAFDM